MTNYNQGDVLTLRSGNVWIVRDVRPSDNDGDRTTVALMDPDNPGHGTAFYADALYRENLVVLHRRGPLPTERYTVSVRDEGSMIYDGVKQIVLFQRYDQESAERRAGQLNAEWQERVLARI